MVARLWSCSAPDTISDAEAEWVRSKIGLPLLHLKDEISLGAVWDALFAVNTRNFGWLDVDCLVMNPALFDEMRRIAPDQAINCVWTHAACGPTKRPFHVIESYFLFFNVSVVCELRKRGLMPQPSTRSPTWRQVRALRDLIPSGNDNKHRWSTLAGAAFSHRLLKFDFEPLILFQLIANVSGYKLNRVRFLTEIDTFNQYNYYSDEAIHPFPTIRHFDRNDWTGPDQKLRLSVDYLLMMSMLSDLPPEYLERKAFLESKFHHFDLDLECTKRVIYSYLSERGVSDRTFDREEFRWLTQRAICAVAQ